MSRIVTLSPVVAFHDHSLRKRYYRNPLLPEKA
nr:MAG TPA: hypothetical protein [Caudoviricetes sp.]